MDAVFVALVTMASTFGGAMAGMWLKTVLPAHHLDDDSRDIIKLATGLVATMTALVLGLVIATAKGTFDKVDASLEDASANILALDRVLARFGPETAPIRDAIRSTVARRIDEVWRSDGLPPRTDDSAADTAAVEGIMTNVSALAAATDAQRELHAEAIKLGNDILRDRWLVRERGTSAVERPFLVVLICWLTLIFASFGLFAPRHSTMVGVLGLCALSVSAAVFLILEMDGPFTGVMKVSSGPMRFLLAHLGQ